MGDSVTFADEVAVWIDLHEPFKHGRGESWLTGTDLAPAEPAHGGGVFGLLMVSTVEVSFSFAVVTLVEQQLSGDEEEFEIKLVDAEARFGRTEGFLRLLLRQISVGEAEVRGEGARLLPGGSGVELHGLVVVLVEIREPAGAHSGEIGLATGVFEGEDVFERGFVVAIGFSGEGLLPKLGGFLRIGGTDKRRGGKEDEERRFHGCGRNALFSVAVRQRGRE